MNLKFDEGLEIEITQPFPVVNGSNTPGLCLDENDFFNRDNLLFSREITRIENGWKIKMTVTNHTGSSVELNNITALDMENMSSLKDFFKQPAVFNLPRQKNDVPGIFDTAIHDDNLEDASFSSAGIKAGDGIDESGKQNERPVYFYADPALAVFDKQSPKALLIAFAGQSKHLNMIRLSCSESTHDLESLKASALFDGIVLSNGESRNTHELLLLYGEDIQQLLQQYINYIAEQNGVVPPSNNTKLSVYCSWYFYGDDFHDHDLIENLDFLHKNPLPFDVFLLDNGWMNNIGDWEAHEKRFKNGMQDVARRIKDRGYMPGLWTCPFIISRDTDILQKYPDMILKNRVGDAALFKTTFEDYYIIDPFSKNTERYLVSFYRKLRDWGFDYHKLDFLRAVFVQDDVVFCDPGKNRAEAYVQGMRLIRQGLGEDAIIAACGGLFEGSTGLCDINRSGSDVQGHWDSGVSRIKSYKLRIKQIVYRNFYNRLWHCDPDALQLRRRTEAFRKNEKHKHLAIGLFNDEEAFSTVVYQFLNGGIACVSERLTDIDADRLALYRHVMPQYAPPARWMGVPNYMPDQFITEFTDPGNQLDPYKVLTLANWSDEAVTKSFDLASLNIDPAKRIAVFEFYQQKFYGIKEISDTIEILLPPHSCRVFRLTDWNGVKTVVVGTDLNLAMGMEMEEWNCVDNLIFGRIQNEWPYPVTITVASPDESETFRLRKVLIPAGTSNFSQSIFSV